MAFCKEQANVLIGDINEDAAEQTVRELREQGMNAQSCRLDVSDVEGHRFLIENLEEAFGPIDILVNNAGITSTTKLLEMTPQEWDFVMSVNVRGAFFLSQAVFERMLSRRYGRIINMGSISGVRGAKYAGAHYSVSKAAVIMMTKVFAKNAVDSGVTVNTISPGIIATDMTLKLGTQIDPNDVPMNRQGKPDEIAAAAVFLASDQSSYITGQNINVNGGQFMS
jgi:NAD(P)-dependent dehydrogenase (short-subunit alcohol dehydrogenase family)